MYLNSKLKQNSDFVPVREHFSLDHIEFATSIEQNRVQGFYKNLSLNSHFQPIYSLAHKRAVGYEALLRASNSNGESISPISVFALAESERETILLDRLSRNIHLRNFSAHADEQSWLFLNIDPLITIKGRQYGPFFKELLQRYHIPPHRTVIEILEGQIDDESLLLDTVEFYKDLGCLVAIDDFGAGHSNFDRIWNLSPEIVKLDRSIIVQAAEDRKIHRILPNLISLIHESGSLSLIEGVETENQALIAMDSGIDFIQGYFFGKPEQMLKGNNQVSQHLPELCQKLKRQNSADCHGLILDKQLKLFENTVKLLKQGSNVNSACLLLLHHPLVKRCYLLDQQGKQIGPTMYSPQLDKPLDPRMKPLQDAENAIWSRRSYFLQAIEQHSTVQISRPYLSIADVNLCITLSMSFKQDNNIQVLCCDLDWDKVHNGK